MIAGRFFFTPHAVNQYRDRFARHLTYEEALAELVRESETARYRHDTHNGASMWRGSSRRSLRMVVKPNPEPLLPTVITVLPSRRKS